MSSEQLNQPEMPQNVQYDFAPRIDLEDERLKAVMDATADLTEGLDRMQTDDTLAERHLSDVHDARHRLQRKMETRGRETAAKIATVEQTAAERAASLQTAAEAKIADWQQKIELERSKLSTDLQTTEEHRSRQTSRLQTVQVRFVETAHALDGNLDELSTVQLKETGQKRAELQAELTQLKQPLSEISGELQLAYAYSDNLVNRMTALEVEVVGLGERINAAHAKQTKTQTDLVAAERASEHHREEFILPQLRSDEDNYPGLIDQATKQPNGQESVDQIVPLLGGQYNIPSYRRIQQSPTPYDQKASTLRAHDLAITEGLKQLHSRRTDALAERSMLGLRLNEVTEDIETLHGRYREIHAAIHLALHKYHALTIAEGPLRKKAVAQIVEVGRLMDGTVALEKIVTNPQSQMYKMPVTVTYEVRSPRGSFEDVLIGGNDKLEPATEVVVEPDEADKTVVEMNVRGQRNRWEIDNSTGGTSK